MMDPQPYAGCQPPPGQLFQLWSLSTVEPLGSFGQDCAQALGAIVIANNSANMTRFIEFLLSVRVVLMVCLCSFGVSSSMTLDQYRLLLTSLEYELSLPLLSNAVTTKK